MEVIKIFSTLGICTFALYLCTILIIFGLPASLSETYYLLQNKYKKGILFTIMMILLAIFMAFPLFEFTPENYKFIAFFMLLGILFTGAAPLFKDSSQSPIHYVGAGISAISSILWTIIIFPENISGFYFAWMIINILVTAIWLTRDKTRWLYAVELLLFVNTFLLIGEFLVD